MNEYLTSWNVERGFETVAELYKIINGRGFIAGSYAAWMAGGYNFVPGDIDIFATSDDNAESIFADCYTQFYMWSGAQSSVARTLIPYSTSGIQYPLQIVNPNPSWKIFPDDIIESFDMDVSRAVLVSETELIIDRNVGLNRAKFLRINDPLRSLKRAIKYSARGFEFPDSELLKLFMTWDAISSDRRDTITQEVYTAENIQDEDSDNDEDGEFWGGYNYDEDDYFDGE